MGEEWLSLGRAAELAGMERQALRELLRSGRLPGVRQQGRWRIARADLAALGPRPPHGPGPAASNGASPAAPGEPAQLALLLREREAEIRRLQDERLHLARLVGFLQAQVMEREARIALLEARALPEAAHAAHDRPGEPGASVLAAEAPPASPPMIGDAVGNQPVAGDRAALAVPIGRRRRGLLAVLGLFGHRAG